MVRVHTRTRKTKRSHSSKVRRREFLKEQKMIARREYVQKEKEKEDKIEALQTEVTFQENLNKEMKQKVADEKKSRHKEIRKRLDSEKAKWKKDLDERDEKINALWSRREKKIRDEEWSKGEREKQASLAVQSRKYIN